MAEKPGDNNSRETSSPHDPLRRKVWRARYVMVMEQIWPRLWAAHRHRHRLSSGFNIWPLARHPPLAAHGFSGRFRYCLSAQLFARIENTPG